MAMFQLTNNRLHYEVNIGGYRTQLASSSELPKGKITVGLRFKPQAKKAAPAKKHTSTDGDFDAHALPQGTVTLFINNQKAGNAHFAPPVPFSTWEGLDIGRDQYTAASKAYAVPFSFEGTLEEVIFEIQ